MTMFRIALATLLLIACAASRAELVDLDTNALREVDGQNGVAIAFDYGLNINPSTNAPLCAAANTLNCRISLQLNNRDNVSAASSYSNGTGKGEWLVFKNVYGRITAPRITLDATTVSYTNDSLGSSTVPALQLSTNNGGTPTPIILRDINIQAIAVEVDTVANATPANRGYATASEDGFLALRVHDLAGATLRGTVNVFACQGNHQSC